MKKAVIFDLDGTLLNTLQDLGEAVEFALQALKIPISHSMEEYRTMVGHGVANLLERSVKGCTVSASQMAELRRQFDAYYSAHSMDHVTVYPGMAKLLQVLKEQGLRLAVLTNKPHMFAQRMVEHFFGRDVFDIIQGQVEGLPKKPNPSTAYLTAEKMGRVPSECIFVGDSETDMQTAVNASMLPVGVLWGFRTYQELTENGAVFLAKTAEELQAILIKKN